VERKGGAASWGRTAREALPPLAEDRHTGVENAGRARELNQVKK
jgi:hypothetical protein